MPTPPPSAARPVTVVAVHGNGGGAFRFARVAPHVPAALRFVPITLPGFDGVPRDPALRTLRDYAGHLHGLVQEQPGPRVLLGHGIGGSIALEYAQHFAVDGLILHAPVGADLDRRLFPRLMQLPGMRALGQWLFSSRLTRPLFKRLLFSRPVPEAYLDRFFDEYRQCTVFGQMFDLITAEWFAALQPVEAPAVLLWGSRERVLKVEQATAFQRLLPGSTVHIVPDWDHFPMIEQPAAYAAEVEQLARTLVAPGKQA